MNRVSVYKSSIKICIHMKNTDTHQQIIVKGGLYEHTWGGHLMMIKPEL